ncbi:efflux transporter outer membrane subunit [Sphingomonas morindae]|uniref:Efflux transporter outer membrane subunit n=1 Tax=Sphingomonas morindae TaxID=1541170 RepID=A0ABY4XBV8_9SPHN|nr:efflux transporter outer membrane subunit [Sphingomonas morindae]USI74369.1 efflux transporter outer membrane subunit [Sphingomonas morindae]
MKRLLPLLLVATGCSFAPAYHRPQTALPQSWKTAEGWAEAVPADQAPRADWWSQFGDPELDRLIGEADAHNQTVAQAEATYRQARAAVREARASLFPTVSANGAVTHTRTGAGRAVVTGGTVTAGGGARATTNYQVSLGASWEPDFFGSLRNTLSSASATAQARLADLATAQLALHGELATDYLSLRGTDAQLQVLAATVEGYRRSLQIASNRYQAGIVARTDVFQAQSQLASAESDLEGLRRTRTQYEDAIAVLVGAPAASFRIAPVPRWQPVVPAVPLSLPGALVQRRPDVASTERAVAAANAQIGVARAAFFPTVSLSGQYGFNNNQLGELFTSAASLWSLGATVAQTLLDFGARSARVAQARAAYDAAVAAYRGTVLTALQDVQDQLVAQTILARQAQLLRTASEAADRSEAAIREQYRTGLVVFTDVVTAQATALQARRALLQAELDRQTAAVALVQALGGGWDESALRTR